MKKVISEQFDVLVIGGGPAGLMAAASAAQEGARVALVEKNDRYGIKLLMTGNGRCNVTQDADNMLEFAKNYKNGRFLISAFNAFGPDDLREFLAQEGVATKIEKNGRVFPVSDQSKDVRDALYEFLRKNNVTFFNTEEVLDVVIGGNEIEKIITKKKEISARNYIFATGGKSYPQTGSSGQGFDWAKKLGHTIVDLKPSLVPIKVTEQWIEELQGVSGHNVGLAIIKDGKKIACKTGDLMFAHYGLSGPLALNMSRDIQKIGEYSNCVLNLDLKPALSFEQVDEIIRKDFEKNSSKNVENCLPDFASPKLRDIVFRLSEVDVSKHAGNVGKLERQKIAKLFKEIQLTIEELFGYEKAMVTSGGVLTKEINSQTMQSKLINNLYFAGEIIDVDGPTGGFNLQMCWSTGFLAGKSAASEIHQ